MSEGGLAGGSEHATTTMAITIQFTRVADRTARAGAPSIRSARLARRGGSEGLVGCRTIDGDSRAVSKS